MDRMEIAIFGLSITSSWGNGHAVTYRGLVSELSGLGHQVTFYERNKPWYDKNRDLPNPKFCRTVLYDHLKELEDLYADQVRHADAVIVGSYVPDGVDVGRWVIRTTKGVPIFYDIDTPVTLAKLSVGDHEYLHPELIPKYKLYLSFTGGPILKLLETKFGAWRARPLYCSVGSDYYKDTGASEYDLGYLGTYSDDRQPKIEALLNQPARLLQEHKFIVAGPLYPKEIDWSPNVVRVEHLSPEKHRKFYASQKFTLNVTRSDMIKAGWSPSIRLFEAAACGTPIISDWWAGLDYFFKPGKEILIADGSQTVMNFLKNVSDKRRSAIAEAARKKVLDQHTAFHRAVQLEEYVKEARNGKNGKFQVRFAV